MIHLFGQIHQGFLDCRGKREFEGSHGLSLEEFISQLILVSIEMLNY